MAETGKYEFYCKQCWARVWRDKTTLPDCPDGHGKMTRKYYAPGVIIR